MLPLEPEPPSFTDVPRLSPWTLGPDWVLSALGHFGRLTEEIVNIVTENASSAPHGGKHDPMLLEWTVERQAA
jgi:hypothetical protein